MLRKVTGCCTVTARNTKPRDDFGLSYSLADHLHLVRNSRVPPGDLADALGLPLEYLQSLKAAIVEGISEDELKELCAVRVHSPGPAAGK